MGLFNFRTEGLALVALALAVLAWGGIVGLWLYQRRFRRLVSQLMTGVSGGDLEAMLNEHTALMRTTLDRTEKVAQRVERLEIEAPINLKNLGVVRFNPFHDTGGDQSFAIVLADDRGHGVVLSSLHARESTRVYAKPLHGWKSDYSLTDEEKQAIVLAQRLPSRPASGR